MMMLAPTKGNAIFINFWSAWFLGVILQLHNCDPESLVSGYILFTVKNVLIIYDKG